MGKTQQENRSGFNPTKIKKECMMGKTQQEQKGKRGWLLIKKICIFSSKNLDLQL